MDRDFAQTVTSKLLALMETHGGNWMQPWIGGGLHRNAVTQKPYRGVNVMLTGMAGFGSPFWATYKQWGELGAQVRKGEKATHIVFWKPLTVKDKATDEEHNILMARDYSVFNAEQVDNAPKLEIKTLPELERHAECERLIEATRIPITFGGDKAFYTPAPDRVTLPKPEQFKSREGYYGTAFHELGHGTGHKSRLDRPLISRFGTAGYAFEELIAETTSALCCAATGITPEPRADHAQYLNSWLKVLKDDKRAIFTAFSKAQEAADWILTAEAPAPEPQPARPVNTPNNQPSTRDI